MNRSKVDAIFGIHGDLNFLAGQKLVGRFIDQFGEINIPLVNFTLNKICLLYTSDAADE